MSKIVGHLYKTRNYGQFKRLAENRNVSTQRVCKLAASLSEKEIINPLIVNEKMEIIDGQGRYEALKKLGKSIYYIVVPGLTNEDCRILNKYNTNWTPSDLVDSYAKSGNENYVRLAEVKKKTNLSYADILNACHKSGRISGTIKNEKWQHTPFEDGKLIFSDDDVNQARVFADFKEKVVDALQCKLKMGKAVIRALIIAYNTENFSEKRFVEQCKKNRSTFAFMQTIKDQLIEFERIYNKNLRSKIYFSDYYREVSRPNAKYLYNDDDISTLN